MPNFTRKQVADVMAGGGAAYKNIFRQTTFDASNSTPGNTTAVSRIGRTLIDKKYLAKDGDVIRVLFAIKKSAAVDNGFVLLYFGTTGEVGSDVAINSAATTAMSGASDNASGMIDFMRVNATTLRRCGNGTLLNCLSGNGAPDQPTDFVVPNMDLNNVFLTVGSYTATAGAAASAEVATLTGFEIEHRPFE